MEQNGHVTIWKVKPGKGAADADIRKGNRILKVAGIDVTSRVVAPMTTAEAQDALDRVTNLLNGTPGTTVELVIEFGIYSPTKKTCIVTRKL
jgi:C-terminal processing protease CtpA/Prc